MYIQDCQPSILSSEQKGPKRTKDGKIIAHTLIGDAEEFAELEHIYVSANDSSIAKKHSAQQQVRKMRVSKNINNLYILQGPVNASQTNEMIIQKQKQLEEKKQKELADREDYLKRLHLFQRYM